MDSGLLSRIDAFAERCRTPKGLPKARLAASRSSRRIRVALPQARRKSLEVFSLLVSWRFGVKN